MSEVKITHIERETSNKVESNYEPLPRADEKATAWVRSHPKALYQPPSSKNFSCSVTRPSPEEQALENDPAVKEVCEAFSKEFGFKVKPVDVLALIFACMKVIIESRQLEKRFRREERDELIRQMESVCESYKSMANGKIFSAIISGALYVVSGAAPIVGFMKGKFLIDKLSSVMDGIKGMDKNEFSKAVMKITEGMAKTTEQTGQIKETIDRGKQHRSESLQRRAGTLEEECTQSGQGYMRDWQDMLDFIMRYLQMEHETSSRIVSH